MGDPFIPVIHSRSARSQQVEKRSRKVPRTFSLSQTPGPQNGHVACSGPRPRHHANQIAECQGHLPAHFGTSFMAGASSLASRHSLKVGNVPLGSRERTKSTFPTGSNSGLVGGSIPLKMGSSGRDWSRI